MFENSFLTQKHTNFPQNFLLFLILFCQHNASLKLLVHQRLKDPLKMTMVTVCLQRTGGNNIGHWFSILSAMSCSTAIKSTGANLNTNIY